MAFSFKECVGRPSGAHRHAIPSPTDIIIYSRTEAAQTGEEGKVKLTEQRNFSDWGGVKDGGGCCKGDVGSLVTGLTINMSLFSDSTQWYQCALPCQSRKRNQHQPAFVSGCSLSTPSTVTEVPQLL